MLVELSDDKQYPVSYITLNRSSKLNALSNEMVVELQNKIKEVEKKSINECRLVIISSKIEKAFSVGADINDWANYNPVESYKASRYGAAVFNSLATLRVPVINILDGWVLGGGLELALSCDIRLSTNNTKIGFPETKIGNAPGWSGLTKLVPLVGPSKAKEILFTGDDITAQEAQKLGLLNFVGSQSEVNEKKESIVKSICSNAPIPIETTKKIIDEMSQRHELFSFIESLVSAYTAGTEDNQEGKQSFFNKEIAHFKGK